MEMVDRKRVRNDNADAVGGNSLTAVYLTTSPVANLGPT